MLSGSGDEGGGGGGEQVEYCYQGQAMRVVVVSRCVGGVLLSGSGDEGGGGEQVGRWSFVTRVRR